MDFLVSSRSMKGVGCWMGRTVASIGAALVALVLVLGSCATEKLDQRGAPSPSGTTGSARSIDLTAVVERARLAFRPVAGRFEAQGPAHRGSVTAGRIEFGAQPAPSSSSTSTRPPRALDLRVSALGRTTALHR